MKKDIFFLLPVFTYGAGQSIKRIVLKLNKKKYNKNIICLGKCQFKHELKNKNIKIFELNYTKLIFAINAIKKILEKNKNNQKILISNIHYTNVLSLIFLSKIKKLKIIVSERTAIKELDIHFGILDFIKKKIIKILIIIFYRKADAIVTNSTKSSKDLKKMTGLKVRTIFSPSYLPLDLPKIKKNTKIKNLIVVSRLSEEKNILFLLKAINLIKDQKFILKIIGDGPCKDSLISFALEKGLSSKVKFLDYKKNIKDYLIQSDLLINCSFFEGFPNSVVEALNHNVPVICSKSHGGIFDILKDNQYGYLFDLNKVENLVFLILNFLKNNQPFLKKTKKSKKNLKRFTIKSCARGYENLIDNL